MRLPPEPPFAILDGALATELERRGADINHPLWSAKLLYENPALIRQVHLAYLDAGADIITTATYQASLQGFLNQGFSQSEAFSLMRSSTLLALEARTKWLETHPEAYDTPPWVAISMGTYGASLADGSEYHGRFGVPFQVIREYHLQKLEILLPAGGDMLLFETIPCLLEIEAIVDILPNVPDLPVAVSMTCANAQHLRSGEPVAEAIHLLNACPHVNVLSYNCTHPRHIEGLLQFTRDCTEKILMVYPNSGEGWDPIRKTWIDRPTRKSIAHYAPLWLKAGASIIGGCCRTTPEDIAALAQLRRSL